MNWIKKLLVLSFLMIPFYGISQIDIRFYFNFQPDSMYYLCKYRGAKPIIIDTLRLDKWNKFSMVKKYDKNTKLPEGIYLLTNEQHYPIIEFLVAKNQKFSLFIEDLEDLNSVKVRGRAKETKLYFKLMAKVRETEANIAALESETGYYPENLRKIDSLKKDLDNFGNSLIIRRKDSFINLVINSLKRHGMYDYWDDFPLYDARILTYPLIDNKLETYFNALSPESKLINDEIDKLIAKTGNCVEVRDYLIWYFYRKFYSPKFMNLDDVYIHLINEYFMKLEMKNVTKSVLELMAERAKYLENLKLGAKLPEIGNLYSVDASYIAVIFYDKTCQKCAQEGRILEDIRTRHPEMVIFPVEVHSGMMENMISFYDIQTTPMIYLLDNQKKIIAKRIKAGQVEQYLNMD